MKLPPLVVVGAGPGEWEEQEFWLTDHHPGGRVQRTCHACGPELLELIELLGGVGPSPSPKWHGEDPDRQRAGPALLLPLLSVASFLDDVRIHAGGLEGGGRARGGRGEGGNQGQAEQGSDDRLEDEGVVSVSPTVRRA
jgi:hypothetical protein